MTPENLNRQLAAIKNVSVTTEEDYDQIDDYLDELYARVKKSPALLTNENLDAFAEIALNSPYRNINSADRYDNEHTPAQEICLSTTRRFVKFTALRQDKRQDIIDRLERIAADSLDYNIRQQAIMSIWGLSCFKGLSIENRAMALTALERQAAANSDPYIRSTARDQILSAAREDQSFIARAMAAQISGTEDKNEEARKRATALLTNRVQSPTCPVSEVRSLLEVFQKVAQKAPDATTREFAQEGIKKAEARLKTGATSEWTFP